MADKGNLSYATLNEVYPVGSVYISVNSTLPAAISAIGTWEKMATGRCLWNTDSGGGTNIAQALPNIKGSFSNERFGWYYGGSASGAFSGSYTGDLAGANYDNGNKAKVLVFNANKSNSVYQDGANVQPNAIAVCMWKRTA